MPGWARCRGTCRCSTPGPRGQGRGSRERGAGEQRAQQAGGEAPRLGGRRCPAGCRTATRHQPWPHRRRDPILLREVGRAVAVAVALKGCPGRAGPRALVCATQGGRGVGVSGPGAGGGGRSRRRWREHVGPLRMRTHRGSGHSRGSHRQGTRAWSREGTWGCTRAAGARWAGWAAECSRQGRPGGTCAQGRVKVERQWTARKVGGRCAAGRCERPGRAAGGMAQAAAAAQALAAAAGSLGWLRGGGPGDAAAGAFLGHQLGLAVPQGVAEVGGQGHAALEQAAGPAGGRGWARDLSRQRR